MATVIKAQIPGENQEAKPTSLGWLDLPVPVHATAATQVQSKLSLSALTQGD
jgi:hypothetical protein